MKLTVVGCSPAWPNPGGAHSGYIVESAGRRLLLDCGPGVLARLRRDAHWPAVDAIVITHLHLDHCGDLIPWLWGHLIGAATGRPGPELWLPPGGPGRLEEFAPRRQFEEAFMLREYAEAVPFRAAGHTVLARRVLHYDEPTWGLRVECGGRVIAYSADSAPTQSLTDLASGADVFLCEATLTEAETRQPRGHMTADEARAIAGAAGARRLLLTHRSSEHPLEELVYERFELDL